MHVCQEEGPGRHGAVGEGVPSSSESSGPSHRVASSHPHPLFCPLCPGSGQSGTLLLGSMLTTGLLYPHAVLRSSVRSVSDRAFLLMTPPPDGLPPFPLWA